MAKDNLLFYYPGEKVRITEKQAVEMLLCTIFPDKKGPCHYETLDEWRERGFIKGPHEN